MTVKMLKLMTEWAYRYDLTKLNHFTFPIPDNMYNFRPPQDRKILT